MTVQTIPSGGLFAFESGDIFILTGIQQNASFISCDEDQVHVSGIGNHLSFAQPIGDTAVVSGISNSVSFSARPGYVATNDVAAIYGLNNQAAFFSGYIPEAPANDTLIDHGFGTSVTIGALVNLSIQDFAADPTGRVNLERIGATPAQAVALEHSDGHGGTMIAFGPNSTIDFVGDQHVGVSHFTG